MTLDKGRPGEEYTVAALSLPQAVEHRLEALGMTLGTRVSVLGSKDAGTLILKVRGTRFAMGRGITRTTGVLGDGQKGADGGLYRQPQLR